MPTSRLAVITFLDGGAPDNALPGLPAYPGNALPFPPAYPGNALPSAPGQPATLPVYPFDPTHLPAPGEPPIVDAGPIVPGKRFIVKWLACSGLILVPDNSLPATPAPK